MDKDSLMLLLAQGVSVEEIGRRFNRHPSTVAYWMAKFGLEAPNREKYAAKGGIEREQLEQLVAQGLSIAADRRKAWGRASRPFVMAGRYGLRTRRRVAAKQRRAPRRASRAGTPSRFLRHHGETEFVIDRSGCYRCRKLAASST